MDTARKKPERVGYTLRRSADVSGVVGGLNVVRAYRGDHVVTGGRDGIVRVWDHCMEQMFQYEGHQDWVNDALCLDEGVVSCSSDSQVKLWRHPGSLEEGDTSGRCLATYSVHTDYVKTLSYSREARRVVSGSLDGTVAWIDPAADATDPSGAVSKAMLYKGVYATATAGVLSAVGTLESCIPVVDWRSGTVCCKLSGHRDMVRALHFVDSATLVSASSDTSLRIWDLRTEKAKCIISVHTAPVWCLKAVEVHGSCHTIISGDKTGFTYLTNVAADYEAVNTTSLSANDGGEANASVELVGGGGSKLQLWAASPDVRAPLRAYDVEEVLRDERLRVFARREASHPRQAKERAASVPPPPPPLPSSQGKEEGGGGVEWSSRVSPSQVHVDVCESPAPEEAAALAVVHNLTSSPIDRHSFSLQNYASLHRTVMSAAGVADPAERYAILRRQIEAELGVAVPTSSAHCAGAVCVLSASLLDTKLHCLARTSHDTLEVWDLTTARVARSVSFQDADDEERCAKELRAEYGRRQGSSASWCTLGTPTGFVTVFLSHPHCFSWESTLAVGGGNGDAAPRSPSSSNPRLNVGESVLLALFAPLVPQTQPPTLEIPAECEQRETWYKGELARLKSKLGKQKPRVRFGLQPHVVVSVWARREAWPPYPSHHVQKRSTPEPDTKVVYAHALRRHEPHATCLLTEVAARFTSPAGGATAATPEWVREAIEELTLNRRR